MSTNINTHMQTIQAAQQNMSVYNIQNLANGEHSLKAELALHDIILFDWVYIYTNESYKPPNPPASYSSSPLMSYVLATSTSRATSTPLPTATSSLPFTSTAVPALNITTSSSSPSLNDR